MKKLVLLASIAIAMIIYQPANAQISVNINIGARPYYTPSYYSYYVPARTVVYSRPVVYRHYPVVYHQKRFVSHKSYAPARVYHTNYSRHYTVKATKYHGNKHAGKGRGKGRH